MNRLTQKHDAFNYVLPCQNVMNDTQAFKIQLEDTDYTVKEYIIGEAIKQFGLIEDVLERYGIENLEEYIKSNQITNYAQNYIKILEKENERVNTVLGLIKQENADLQHRLEVTEKALELACKYNIPDNHITLRFEDGVQVENWRELKRYALQQAEKELKGE